MRRLIVTFEYRQLQKDMGLTIPEVQMLFKRELGISLARSSIYAWFQRGKIPWERLCQLLALVRLATDVKLDPWAYIVVQVPKQRAA